MRKTLIYLLLYILLLLISLFIALAIKPKPTLTGCWMEKDISHTEGNCRHNGILTDSGWLFRDTIYIRELNRLVPHTTLIKIIKNK